MHPVTRIAFKLAQLYESPATPGRILSMEGIRGFAVLLVFCVHFHSLFGVYLDPRSTLFGLSRFAGAIGLAGVDLFFILSGYLIYGQLLRKPVRLVDYLRRRAQRIYPAFLCVLSVYLLLHIAAFPGSRIPHEPVAAAIYLLQNAALMPGLFHIQPLVTVAWSLSYEVFFYIALPVMIILTGLRSWRPAARCGFVITLAALYTSAHLEYAAFDIGWLRLSPFAHPRLLMFVAGILVYEVHAAGWAARLKPWGEIVAALLMVAAFVVYNSLSSDPQLVANWRTAISGVAVLSIGLSGVVLYSLPSPGFFQRVFSWTPLRCLGNMSYSYYLIHALALHGLKQAVLLLAPAEIMPPWIYCVSLALGFPVTIAASTILFALIEKPMSLKCSPLLFAKYA